MQISDYLKNLLNEAAKGSASLTFPASYFIRHYSGNPTGTGTGGTETSNGGYVPVEYENIPANWQNEAGGGFSNLNVIRFAAATADQGAKTHFALWDAATGGNMWFYATFVDENGDPITVTILENQEMVFASGELIIKAV